MIDNSQLLICISTFAIIYMARLKIELETELARKKADAARVKCMEIELENVRVNSMEIELENARLKIELETELARKKADAARVNSMELELELETERAEALEKQLRYDLSSMTIEQWNSLNDNDRRLNEDLCKQYGIPLPNMQESSYPGSTEQDGERIYDKCSMCASKNECKQRKIHTDYYSHTNSNLSLSNSLSGPFINIQCTDAVADSRPSSPRLVSYEMS
jgi:hypothetical protein